MRVIQWAVACIAVLAAAAGQAQAGMVTVDPDGFATGTSLTNAFSGVTITQGNGETNITAAPGLTGTQQFAIHGAVSDFPGEFTYLPLSPSATLSDTLAASQISFFILRFDFDAPTDFVSLDLIPNDGFDPGSISAFDSSGNLIGFDSFDGVSLTAARHTLSISGSGIKTLLAAGDNDGNNLEIDTLTYNLVGVSPVPEPSSLALFGIGACVAGVGAARRRRLEKLQRDLA